MSEIILRIRVWDLPIRVFHWTLAALIVAAVITGNVGGGAIVWHGRIGLAIVGLMAFRLVWGFVGSEPARFASFFPTPASIIAYLRGQWSGIGHNPLGALSVFGLLALVAVQVSSGLFANDDIAFQGYLAELVSKELSNELTGLHRIAIKGLFALIVLHLLAIAFYTHVKKETLIAPMVTGWKTIQHANLKSPRSAGKFALIAALVIALGAVYAASGAWITRPQLPAAPASASW